MAEQHFPSCWLWSRGDFCKATWLCSETRSTLTGMQSVGLRRGFCPACLSLFSDANFHANGLLSCLFGLCRTASSRKTMIIDSCILVRSMERHCYHWKDDNYECALCRDRVQWDQDSRLTYDTSPDIHTVCSNRISSTQSIPCSFPSAVFL